MRPTTFVGFVRAPRILLLHNRYRFSGGEERSVELQRDALSRANVAHTLLEHRSEGVARSRAAAAVLSGGSVASGVATGVREFGADIVHAHNIQPLIGPRGLAAARRAGARVVLHLHNARLFCAIGVASRDGGPCFRCRGRRTLPGLVLNCRGSVPEAVVYAAGLALHQPTVWEVVDRFVAPSRHAARQLAMLGVPGDRLEVLPHYVPEHAFVDESRADHGRYALVVARLAPEKGIDTAIEAAAVARVPVRVAGDGPAARELAALVHRVGAPVELLGRVGREELADLLLGAAMVFLPSRAHEFAPYAALEAMAAGVPVIATRLGGLPELIGEERCIAPNDVAALAARMRSLWEEPELRRVHGDALLALAREHHAEQRYTQKLLRLYDRVRS
jgi:glycosyltransferase involved in cell wall biosynthesis